MRCPTRQLSIIALATVTAGCATQRPHVTVAFDGYRALGDTLVEPGKRVALTPDPKATNPILEQELHAKLAAVLRRNGYVVAPAESADVVLVTTFGVGTPRQVLENSLVYVPGTKTTVVGPSGAVLGTLQTFGSLGVAPSATTVHDRWLVLSAYDAQELRRTQTVRHLWRGEARSTGRSGDLRLALNYLLVPTAEMFGGNTGQTRIHHIPANDPRVLKVYRQAP